MKLHVRQYKPSKRKTVARLEESSSAEWNALWPVIDNKPERILDFGCGLGRMSVFAHSKFQDPSIEYVLYDGNSVPEKEGDGTGFTRRRIFYNDLRMTELFCRSNDLTNYAIINAENQPVTDAGGVDLVMSFLSLGYHYPIEDSLDEIISILNPGGVVAAGVREGLYETDMFLDRFDVVEIRPIEYFGHYSEIEELLVLKKPKIRRSFWFNL
jgi:SAM-dependent methyltransferase